MNICMLMAGSISIPERGTGEKILPSFFGGRENPDAKEEMEHDGVGHEVHKVKGEFCRVLGGKTREAQQLHLVCPVYEEADDRGKEEEDGHSRRVSETNEEDGQNDAVPRRKEKFFTLVRFVQHGLRGKVLGGERQETSRHSRGDHGDYGLNDCGYHGDHELGADYAVPQLGEI